MKIRIELEDRLDGVPAEIDTRQYGSLVELFEKSIREFGDRPAFTNMGKTLRFSELVRYSRTCLLLFSITAVRQVQ